MIGEGAHFEFIAWAYAGAGLVTLALVAYVVWDARRVKAKLAALDKAGIRRRSAGSSS
ncbi:MAG: heme exporter protein CcmD [Devosia sp.]|uniref:heme exporter protein CcmD n=1 Tax=Devosia sp. TaxID=1871048 RepID=UPI001AC7A970|nr:heme exporter protein CcmD [Devosia sp.]MBN9310980.1 heme exporter protein CcmD [Devosia sp.]MBN9316691.1 heme exporter protein CcmD [Devosia sp.]